MYDFRRIKWKINQIDVVYRSVVSLNTKETHPSKCFKYLDSIYYKNKYIDQNVKH